MINKLDNACLLFWGSSGNQGIVNVGTHQGELRGDV